MPVVRELINRIAFKVNPGDVANAEKAFDKLTRGGAGMLGSVSKLVDLIGDVGKAYIGLQATATAVFVSVEKSIGKVEFFAKTQEQADMLLSVFDKVAQKSETTSVREAKRAASIMATLNMTESQFRKLAPFIEQISIANPALDFESVAEQLKSVIGGGDLEAFMNLIPGMKKELEILSKTTISKPFGDIMEQDRAVIVLDMLTKKQERINELVEKRKKDLGTDITRLGKESSDFLLKFGENTAPAVGKATEAIKDMFKEMNKSETLWKKIDDVVNGIIYVIDKLRKIPHIAKVIEEQITTVGGLLENTPEGKSIAKERSSRLESGLVPETLKAGQLPGLQTFKRTAPQDININANITLKGEDVGNLNMDAVKGYIEDAIDVSVIQPIKNLAAKNGALVGAK